MVNKVILVGRLGADPEVKFSTSGLQITNFRMATDAVRKNEQGETVKYTEWHRLVSFGKSAEAIGTYAAKGRLMFIEGRIQTREWTDKEGTRHWTTEIIVESFRFLASDGKKPTSEAAQDPCEDEIPF